MAIEILGNLKRAVIEYDREGAASWARRAVDEEIDPITAVDALTGAIREVGDAFGRGELWLPDLVGAADAMQAATPILEEELKRTGAKRETPGTVVGGTVFGDIHSIGKSMVFTLLIADGFTVYDLGVNVTAEEFIRGVKEHKADILAMSALLTTTAAEQRKVISSLKKGGLRDKVKVIVGGAAITREFAESIEADGYESTAPEAVKLARRLIAKK